MDGFDIIEKLGDGAYSVVYKVKRKEDGNIYALKKVKLKGLTEKEKQNSLNEVRILASVKSPFVISYKEAFIEEESESLCIVMEYADKGDLYQKIVHLKKVGTLIEEIDAWKIFIQMTRGLKSLHDLKILHRDLKSANIFLFSNGSAKIGDLNVSKVARKGLGYTQTGTPYYASPEVWNESPYDNKSDIWSLGCVFYEMLTLHPPFRAKDMEALYKTVIKGDYKKVGNKYSEDINEIIDYLLKVNPKERPSCDEILKHPIIKKRLEFFQAQAGEDLDLDNIDEGVLLRTIRIPKNIVFLSDNLPEKNYEKSKSHSKAMGRNIHKKEMLLNQNSSLQNIKTLNVLKSPSELNNMQTNDNHDLYKNSNSKNIKKEISNISLSKNNLNIENKLKKEKSYLGKYSPINQTKNELDKKMLDLIQMERRKYNLLKNNKNINSYMKYYEPNCYKSNNSKKVINNINKYRIDNKVNNEGYKHQQILPNIFNSNSIGANVSNNRIITNKRLKPIVGRRNIIKINP